MRLDVADVQAGLLWRAAGARRFAHNWAIAAIKANADQWAAEACYDMPKPDRVRPLTYFTLGKAWTAAKPALAPWSGEHSTWTFRYGIRAAAEAHQAFLKGTRRFPRFKSRHTDRARFTVADGLHLELGRLRLANYGWVRIGAPCHKQADLRRGRARLLNVTATRHADGHWYATLCFERLAVTTPEQRTAPTGPTVGVDLGIKTLAVAATAARTVMAELAGGRYRRDAQRRLAHLQRDFSRTRRRSVNRTKAAARLGRAHARVSAQRADAVHGFTAHLAGTHGVVVVEDLATANLLGNHRLAGAIADQGWGELSRQLAHLQDVPPRRGPDRRGPVVRELENVLGLWCGETQAHPGRAHLPLRIPSSSSRSGSRNGSRNGQWVRSGL